MTSASELPSSKFDGYRTREFARAQPDRLIVFARYPEPGQTKTRLIPALGPDRAAQLQAALTRRTLNVARRFCSEQPCDLEVRFTGADDSFMRTLFGDENQYSAQQGNDLGERLAHAVSAALQDGARRVVVIGTDCPEIDPTILREAFAGLSHADVVLGPAIDGGFYLIGLRANHPELFCNITWGTENVLRQTLEIARRGKCKVLQLRPLADVDFPEDLIVCRRVSCASGALPEARPGLLSIIIPTYNEERMIEQTLKPLVALPAVEIIIADGGSTDATTDIAGRMGCSVVRTRLGRGRQMNAGAAIASGEVLLFLHADTQLPDGFQKHVWATLNQGAVAGAFQLRIDDGRPRFRWIEWGANLRSRYLKMPYGDQGIFLRSELFHRVGGFPNWPLMEDYELCRRLRSHGRLLLAPVAVSTSARRWLSVGMCRTTLVNQLCIVGFRLGISPEKLARWYSSCRGAKNS